MQRKLMTAVMLAAVATTTLATSGCKNLFRAYRIDVVQGQTVTQEQADQIKTGMTPAQVRYVLGTPLVTDTLNPSRWDYAYKFIPGTYALESKIAAVPHRRFSVIFSAGVVERTESDSALPAKTASLPGSKDSAVRANDTTVREQANQEQNKITPADARPSAPTSQPDTIALPPEIQP
ncbi:MAG: outer membrane protein assembly factor BamE [Pseudomonadota bacterium]